MRAGPTDIELLDRWRDGDLSAGDQLFTRHFAAIHRFFKNKIDADVIEDLVQQTFMATVEGRERFRRDSKFSTYLFGTAYNVLRNYYRRIRTRPEAVDVMEVSIEELAPGPATALGRRREERLLAIALRRIPVQSQIVLELYYWEDMAASEMAQVLGVPEGTVRGRVRRAKQLIVEQLQQLTDDPQEVEATINDIDRWAVALRDESNPPQG